LEDDQELKEEEIKPKEKQSQIEKQILPKENQAETEKQQHSHYNFKMINQLLLPPSWVYESVNEDPIIQMASKRNGGLERWWEGQMAAAMFCPKKEVLDYANHLRVENGWPATDKEDFGTIGMHVRRGDRKDLKMKFPVEEYVKLAYQIKSKYGTSRIYVASDDETVADQILNMTKGDFVVISQSKHSSSSDYSFSKGNLAKSTSMSVFIDLHLLSECQHFIGPQRSMFSWTASRIRLGKGNENFVHQGKPTFSCPIWIGNEVSNQYGWWKAPQKIWNGPFSEDCV